MVVKVSPQAQGYPIQSLVNIVSIQDVIFDEQARMIRRMYDDYKPRAIAIDGTGVGSGLVDLLVKPQYIVETGELLPSFGVINDEDGEYKRYKDADTIDNVIYIIKANAPLNTEMHANLQNQLRHGRVKFLIDENVAKGKLLESGVGKKMSPEQRGDRLRPYTLTTVLKMQLLNLVQENEGQNIILKQANKGMKKDKVSSLEMALYWIKLEEDHRSHRRSRRFSDFMFLS